MLDIYFNIDVFVDTCRAGSSEQTSILINVNLHMLSAPLLYLVYDAGPVFKASGFFAFPCLGFAHEVTCSNNAEVDGLVFGVVGAGESNGRHEVGGKGSFERRIINGFVQGSLFCVRCIQ